MSSSRHGTAQHNSTARSSGTWHRTIPLTMELPLYSLPKATATAAKAQGIDDLERRQHVQQLTHRLLEGCKQAGQPFTWLRAHGLRRVSDAINAGLEDAPALATALDATHSQVIEAILSTLDRDMALQPPPLPELPPLWPACAAAAPHDDSAGPSSKSSATEVPAVQEHMLTQEQTRALLDAVGRCPAGHAPNVASVEELLEAYRVVQALVLLHGRSRALLGSAQYAQLLTARACEAPLCLPHALPVLLTVLQGSEEAQAVFVTTGGLDMLLRRCLHHVHAAAAADSDGTAVPPDLLHRLFVFLQLFLGWVLGEAVRRGAHSSCQHTALSLLTRHLGADSCRHLTQGLSQLVEVAGADGPAGCVPAAAAAAAGTPQLCTTAADDSMVAVDDVLSARAAAAASALLPWS